jgi:hypothetical protein
MNDSPTDPVPESTPPAREPPDAPAAPEPAAQPPDASSSRYRHELLSRAWNGALQIARDPRWWPRELPLKRERLLGHRVVRADLADWPLPTAAQLRALADAQFLEAKLWYAVVTRLYVLAAALALSAYFIYEAGDPYQYAAIAAVIGQILAALARLRATRLHSVAHEADWRALILDALEPADGETSRAIQLENLVSDGARDRAGRIPDYYSSELPKGDPKLVANLRETAFFTAALYNTAATRAVWLGVVVVIPPLGPFIYSVLAGVVVSPAVAIVAVTSFLPLWDVFARNRAWRASAATLDRVTDALFYVTDLRTALPLFTDAVIATATAPPIPTAVYQRQSDQLRTNWKRLIEDEREQTQQGQSHSHA